MINNKEKNYDQIIRRLVLETAYLIAPLGTQIFFWRLLLIYLVWLFWGGLLLVLKKSYLFLNLLTSVPYIGEEIFFYK